MKITQPRLGLLIIVSAFMVLGVIYSVATPVLEAPDESFHFFFVQYVREQHRLPVQGQPGEALYKQEGSQPPLYYLAGALLTSWIDTRDARDLLRQNPQANLGDPGDPGNKNRFIHTAQETWPFQGAAFAAHVLRGWSLVLGLIVVLCTYATARLLLPDWPVVATLAAALIAFTPQFIFISSAINNDNLINALAALTLYLLARLWRGDRSFRTILWLALAVGLATLAKLGGLIVLGFAVATIGYLGFTRREWRWTARSIAVLLGGAVLIGGWWYWRNAQLYGDITGLAAMYVVVGQRVLTMSELIAELPGLWYSFWGVFGWFSIALPEWIYLIYAALILLALTGGGLAMIRWLKVRRLPPGTAALIGLGGYAWLVFSGVLRWTSTTHGSQGRLLFPAASALAILLACGLWTILRSTRIVTGIAAGLFVIAAAIPWGVIAPEYAPPARVMLDTLPVEIERLNVDFNDTLRLIGGYVETSTAQPGDLISVVLYWQALRQPDREYMVYVHLLGRELELVGGEDAYHGQGTFPADLWIGDEIIADRFTLRLKPDVRAPAVVRVEAGVRDCATNQPVRVTNADGSRRDGLIVVDDFVLRSKTTVSMPQITTQYRFGDQIELVGYGAPRVGPAGEVTYRLYWRTISRAGGLLDDYTVFAHALDGNSQMVGQGDGQPFNGDYPTSRWQPDETVVEERTLKVNGVPTTLTVGLYRLADGTRLPIVDQNGQRVVNDEIVLPVLP